MLKLIITFRNFANMPTNENGIRVMECILKVGTWKADRKMEWCC